MIPLRITKYFSTVVLADHSAGQLSKSTLKILNGAKLLNQPITLLLTTHDDAVVEHTKTTVPAAVVSKVLVAKHPCFKAPQADTLTQLLQDLIQNHGFTNVVTSTSSTAKDFLPRLAAKHLAQPVTDIVAVDKETLSRPVYAGNAVTKVKSKDKVKFLSLRPTNFEEISTEGAKVADVQTVDVANLKPFIHHVSDQVTVSDKPDLKSARFVVSGGRALGSKENFKLLEDLADVMGSTAIGASRAAVDAGYAPNDQQVGQTGKIVAPELYIAVGISGAIQHLAGMKDSKVIVSINKDAEAPIVSVADYNIVGDLFKVVPELTQKLKALK